MAGLSGMKEICTYMKRSEATVLKWFRDYDLPLVKLDGTWEADTERIDEWRKALIDGRSTINGGRIPAGRRKSKGRRKEVRPAKDG